MFAPPPPTMYQQLAFAFQPRQQNVLERIYDKVFTPSDPYRRMQYEAEKLQRLMAGRGTIEWMRLATIGAHVLAAVQFVGNSIRNPFLGALVIAAGALMGNYTFDLAKAMTRGPSGRGA